MRPPVAVPGPASRRVKAVISDLDGVMYRGEIPIPGSPETVRGWIARDLPFVFITNNATLTAAEFASRLTAMGAPTRPDQVITSCTAAGAWVAAERPGGARVFPIGTHALRAALEEGGAALVDGPDADVVALGFDYGLTYAMIRTAVKACLNGATLVVTNPDVLTPDDDGFEPCVGAFAAAICAAVPGLAPVVVGKPAPFMIEEALRRLGAAPEDAVMIGDQIVTDIACAHAAGVRGWLVRSGAPAAPAPGIEPDLVAERLADLPF